MIDSYATQMILEELIDVGAVDEDGTAVHSTLP